MYRKKKVLFFITKSTWGGAQRNILDLATNLPTDYEPVLMCGGHGELVQRAKEAGVRTISIENLVRDVSILKEIKTFFQVLNIVRQEKPDVLHSTSSKAGLLGSVIGRLLFVPKVIFTASAWAFNEDRPQLQKILIKFSHWLTVILSHQSLAISRSIKAEMNWLGAQKKLKLVYLGRKVPELKNKAEARDFLANHDSQANTNLRDYTDDLWIGTIAELHKIKRLNVAIDAVGKLVKQHPRLRFIITHDGDERENLQNQVKEAGLEEHIFFTGTISDAASLIPAFDIFILPSKSEAFGYVLVEAGLAQVPVVATEVGGIPDIVEKDQTGLLVPPDDSAALAEAIEKYIDDPDMRARFAQAHYDNCQKFTIEHMMEKTLEIYNS